MARVGGPTAAGGAGVRDRSLAASGAETSEGGALRTATVAQVAGGELLASQGSSTELVRPFSWQKEGIKLNDLH